MVKGRGKAFASIRRQRQLTIKKAGALGKKSKIMIGLCEGLGLEGVISIIIRVSSIRVGG